MRITGCWSASLGSVSSMPLATAAPGDDQKCLQTLSIAPGGGGDTITPSENSWAVRLNKTIQE